MNQIVTRRAPSRPFVLTLDLSDDRKRQVQELIRRTHTGRWPLWRGYAMHCDGNRLYALVEWVPRSRSIDKRRFNVVLWTVSLNAIATEWQGEHMTRREAAALFAQLKRGNAANAEEVGVRIGV